MATGVYSWSQTAATNATADTTVNWQEGQAPSSVNDSARAMMASVAKWRDDISGAITAGGTSSAYTITSNQGFASFAAARLSMFTFIASATNAAGVTLNLDSTGAQPINGTDGVAIPAGTLVSGGVYQVTAYTNEWILHSFFADPYAIPLGSTIDYFGTTAPNSNFVFPFGQAISRTTYATLFSLMSTTFGVGDGSTTFNIPDLRGRIVAGKDDMGGSAASRLSSTSITTGGATTLGGSGGAETKALATANLPAYTPAGTIAGTVGAMSVNMRSTGTSGANDANTISIGNTGGSGIGQTPLVIGSSSLSATFTGTAQGGTATAFALTQPTIIANKILRII